MIVEEITRASRGWWFAGVAMVGCVTGAAPIHAQPATDDPLPACTAPLAKGDCEETFDSGAQQGRRFIVHVPDLYDGTRKVPLLLDLHGHTGTPEKQRRTSGQLEQSDSPEHGGFIAVWPAGIGKSWNFGPCCKPASAQHVDDVAFLLKVIETVEGQASIDADRVYITGHSNGAAMAHKMGCEAADVVRAVAPVSYPLPKAPCTPTRDGKPVSLAEITYHGSADTVVGYGRPYDYDPTPGADYHGPAKEPGSNPTEELDSLKRWATINGCDTRSDPNQTSVGSGTSYALTYSGCKADRTTGKPVVVRLVTVLDADHGAYPGEQSSNPNKVDVAQDMWDNLFDPK